MKFNVLLKINIKGDLRTASYLYSENVGKANKQVFLQDSEASSAILSQGLF
jgi:hypothetical protein